MSVININNFKLVANYLLQNKEIIPKYKLKIFYEEYLQFSKNNKEYHEFKFNLLD